MLVDNSLVEQIVKPSNDNAFLIVKNRYLKFKEFTDKPISLLKKRSFQP